VADVNIDKAEVGALASLLHEEGTEIVDDLTSLLAAVTGLLGTPEGGLWMRMSSPVLSAAYQEFTKVLQDAIRNIPAFADSFDGIAQKLIELDQDVANSARQ
jgi:hypothetical protein